MYRRTFLTLTAAASILISSPALAGWDEGVAAVFSATPRGGVRATVTVTRNGGAFALIAGGQNFNIGMPPAAELRAIRGDIEVQINGHSLTLRFVRDDMALARIAGGTPIPITLDGGTKFQDLAETQAGRFATVVGLAAAAFEAEGLGTGGEGFIMGDGITMVLSLRASN